MDDTLSQSDLDALFGEVTPPKSGDGALSQSDLDALFGDIPSAENADTKGTSEGTDAPEGLKPAQPGEGPGRDTGAAPSSGSEIMSQDEIDKLLAELLG